jgi:transposase
MQILFEGWSYAAAADGFAVSVRTVAKWVRRFKEGGVAALEDASSRPGVPPHQTSPGAVALIRILREQHGLPFCSTCHRPHSPVTAAVFTPYVSTRTTTPSVASSGASWSRA